MQTDSTGLQRGISRGLPCIAVPLQLKYSRTVQLCQTVQSAKKHILNYQQFSWLLQLAIEWLDCSMQSYCLGCVEPTRQYNEDVLALMNGNIIFPDSCFCQFYSRFSEHCCSIHHQRSTYRSICKIMFCFKNHVLITSVHVHLFYLGHSVLYCPLLSRSYIVHYLQVYL